MFTCAVFFVLGFMSPSLSLISISILSHMSISCKPSHCIWLLYIVLYILVYIYIYIHIYCCRPCVVSFFVPQFKQHLASDLI